MFFEVANELTDSLSKSLADDHSQLAPVVKTLFDVVCSFSFILAFSLHLVLIGKMTSSRHIQLLIFRP